MIFDYDGLAPEQLQSISATLRTSQNVFAFFISPSGNGIKVIYRLDKTITDYNVYSALYKHYARKFKISLGENPDHTSDAARPCYFSYDPDLYLNDQAEPLVTDIPDLVVLPKIKINFKKVADDEIRKVEEAVSFLKNKIDSYDDWYKSGLALAGLGEVGRKYFLELSRNEKYSDTDAEIDAKFDNLLQTRTGEVTLGTLFAIAKEKGFKFINIPTPAVDFSEILRKQFDLDDTRDHTKLLGFNLSKFKELAQHCDGIQPGFYLLGAESNVGKTAVLTNMTLDLLDTNPEVRVLYYSLDDASLYTAYRFLGILTGQSINQVRKGIQKGKLQPGREKLLSLVDEKRLIVKDIGEINNIEQLKQDIESITDHSNIVVVIDGLYNLEVGDRFKGGIREENIERARQIKELVDIYRIPVLTTGELRKKTKEEGKDKAPTVHDLMETGKFAYNANVVWLLYGKVNELKSDEPALTLEYVKNKLSDYKGEQTLIFTRGTGTMRELPSMKLSDGGDLE